MEPHIYLFGSLSKFWQIFALKAGGMWVALKRQPKKSEKISPIQENLATRGPELHLSKTLAMYE